MNSKMRIKSSDEFEKILLNGKTIKSDSFTIFYQNKHLSFSRFGIALGKKFGNAVIRNKYKRILREIIRNNEKKFKNDFDYIIIMKKKCLGLSFQEIENNLISLLVREEK